MDKLNIELIRKIEDALDLKLKEWQINYILSKPMVLDMNIVRRYSGKTLAYIIKLLFESDTPIEAYNLKNIRLISDDYNHINNIDNSYILWFRNYLLELHDHFIKYGIVTRPVFCNSHEKLIFEKRFKI